MKVLITGNLGYIGPIVSSYLKKNIPNVELFGYDSGFFSHLNYDLKLNPDLVLSTQYYGDIRDISEKHLEGIDCIVHLAAISNDPMGNQFSEITSEINQKASVRLVELSVKMGVKNFVFASSCSVYGESGDAPRKESDLTSPLTSYAKSKVGTEEAISNLQLQNMTFTSLRFATACGWSPRIRLDLVLNDFVACALSSKEITVLSDGSPWRPIIDVEDMSRAILWALFREKDYKNNFLIINTGSDRSNYQVKHIANSVAKIVNGTKVSLNEKSPPDKRSYIVDFSLFKKLAPNHQPIITLDESIQRVIGGLVKISFIDSKFRDSSFMRLNVIREHLKNNLLNSELRWI